MAKAKEISVQQALDMQKRQGYRPYEGPKLEGPRFALAYGAEEFPKALMGIPEPPGMLYGIGDPSAMQEGIAIIGARKATPYGRGCARRFGRIAAARGIVIISGGARGCDAEAHRAALAERAPTVAFLGGGCDQPYPKGHVGLFQQIIDGGGCVVSEREWGFPALPFTFRARNRLIAGLARATLIVEAGLPSGTFSTADEALGANRDVLVVPGAITSRTSAGSNRLLYQGAVPIVDDDSFEDALSQLFGLLRQESYREPKAPGTAGRMARMPVDDVLYDALAAEPLRLEEIMAKVPPLIAGKGNPTGYVQLHLAELERDGWVGRYPDGRFGPLKV